MKISARIFLFSLVFSCFFVFTGKTLAQSTSGNDNSKATQNWQCLETTRSGGHTVTLSTKNANSFPPPGTPVYIIECVSTKQGTKCTSGQCDADQALVGNCNDLSWLKANYEYNRETFTGSEPVNSDFEGKVGPFTWTSSTKVATGHTFFGVGLSSPNVLGEGNWPSLQLGTFYFPNSSDTCSGSTIRWDPYGRVFDSVSLEPVPNVRVSLYSKLNGIASLVDLPALTNPQTTDDEGVFNFVVPDGTYNLLPNISTHTYPNNPDKLNRAWDRFYSDLYRGEDIVQQGFIQHRDIPIDPIGAPFTSPVRIVDYSIILDKLNSKLIIEGSVSHPLSIIRIYSGNTFLKQITATKFGVFRFTVDDNSIDQSQPIRLEVTKGDYGSLQGYLLVKPAYAGESYSLEIAPIMNNIEGYAFDKEGNNIPLAQINVVISASSNTFYTTKADTIGYFNIPAQYLPPVPYYLEITSPDGKSLKMDTTEFARLNTSFAKAASVNYGSFNPQIPGNEVNSAYSTKTAEDGTVETTVIGPDGKVADVDIQSGELNPVPQEGQIITDEQVKPENLTPGVSENVTVSGSRNKSNLFVFLFIIIFIIIAFLFLISRKKKPASP